MPGVQKNLSSYAVFICWCFRIRKAVNLELFGVQKQCSYEELETFSAMLRKQSNLLSWRLYCEAFLFVNSGENEARSYQSS